MDVVYDGGYAVVEGFEATGKCADVGFGGGDVWGLEGHDLDQAGREGHKALN